MDEPRSVVAQLISDTVFGDLDLDGDIDSSDWDEYISWALGDLTGLSLADAYARGDLNGDGVNNPDDMQLFIAAYDAEHGPGAFAQMVSRVPEPTSLLLILLFGAVLAPAGVRRTS